MDPDVNQVFNPESVMENGGINSFQKFTTPNGAYLYGYEINGDGNITLQTLEILT
jgi:polysaccharide export outer membrane protein